LRSSEEIALCVREDSARSAEVAESFKDSLGEEQSSGGVAFLYAQARTQVVRARREKNKGRGL
jgi:hypothetical protein